jgi:hypothetical protein
MSDTAGVNVSDADANLQAQFYMNYLVSRARAAVLELQSRWKNQSLDSIYWDHWMGRMLGELVGLGIKMKGWGITSINYRSMVRCFLESKSSSDGIYTSIPSTNTWPEQSLKGALPQWGRTF